MTPEPKPSLGAFIPSSPALLPKNQAFGPAMRDAATAAADAGLRSAWVFDHMLPAPAFYADMWCDPFVSLGAIAGIGNLRLGVGVLVVPVRQPVLTAKAISSLQALSGRPFQLGVGTGWYDKEFEAVGRSVRQRGRLTDEAIEVIELMFAGGGSYEGEFFQFADVYPGDLGPAPEIWVGGGSQMAHEKSVERAVLAPAVGRRIVRHKHWAIRPSATVASVTQDLRDLEVVAREQSTDLSDLRKVHLNFVHLVETNDPRKARDEQYPLFYKIMSEARGTDYFEGCYLTGTIDEIRGRLAAWQELGVEEIILAPLTDPIKQFELWSRHLGDVFDLG